MSEVIISLPTSLDEQSILSIREQLRQASNSEECSAIVFDGELSVFCRGMDFEFLYKESEKQNFSGIYSYVDLVMDIYRCQKITLSVIEGEAIGGGLGIASVCDYVVASESSRFALPEALFGMLPGVVIALLYLRCHSAHIKKIALAVESFSAEEARHIGLVDDIIPHERMTKHIASLLKNFTRCHPDSINSIKRVISENEEGALKQRLDFGVDQLRSQLLQPEVLKRLKDYHDYGMVNWRG